MSPAGQSVRATQPHVPAEATRVVTLLLFEAAGCMMALPVAEVSRLVRSPAELPGGESSATSTALVELDAHFGANAADLWIAWRRGHQARGLRISRVIDVHPCPVRDLRPMPAWLRAACPGGPFWAMGTYGDEVFLLLDPTKVASSSNSPSGEEG